LFFNVDDHREKHGIVILYKSPPPFKRGFLYKRKMIDIVRGKQKPAALSRQQEMEDGI
jgi:hypothetical protein